MKRIGQNAYCRLGRIVRWREWGPRGWCRDGLMFFQDGRAGEGHREGRKKEREACTTSGVAGRESRHTEERGSGVV
eukprot:2248630-Rhodomonas_salina.3